MKPFLISVFLLLFYKSELNPYAINYRQYKMGFELHIWKVVGACWAHVGRDFCPECILVTGLACDVIGYESLPFDYSTFGCLNVEFLIET